MKNVYIVTEYDGYSSKVASVHKTKKGANKKADKLRLKEDDMFTVYYVIKRKLRG